MNALMQLIAFFLQILTFAILARSILTWFPMSPGSAVTNVLMMVTEPILAPLRRIVPKFGMLDLTPLIAIILLTVMSRALESAAR